MFTVYRLVFFFQKCLGFISFWCGSWKKTGCGSWKKTGCGFWKKTRMLIQKKPRMRILKKKLRCWSIFFMSRKVLIIHWFTVKMCVLRPMSTCFDVLVDLILIRGSAYFCRSDSMELKWLLRILLDLDTKQSFWCHSLEWVGCVGHE